MKQPQRIPLRRFTRGQPVIQMGYHVEAEVVRQCGERTVIRNGKLGEWTVDTRTLRPLNDTCQPRRTP